MTSGSIYASDIPSRAKLAQAGLSTGSIAATEIQSGTIACGVVISDTTSRDQTKGFIQGALLNSGGLTQTFSDATYTGGYWSGDGTQFDSTYVQRAFNPLWIDYSIWYTPDATTEHLRGTRNRMPMNAQVGNYYANMEAPTPGKYEIRWRYQKDVSSYVREIREPFTVTTWGISSNV